MTNMEKLRKWLPTFELREGDMTKDFDRFEKLEKIMYTKSLYFPDDIQELYSEKFRDVYQKKPYFRNDKPKIVYHVYYGDDGYGSEVDIKRLVHRKVECIFNRILETERIVHGVVKRIFERVEYKRNRELGILLAEKITRDFGSAHLQGGLSKIRGKAMYEIEMFHTVPDYRNNGRYCERDCYLYIRSRIGGLRVRFQPCDELITEGMIAGEIEIFRT